MAESKWWKVSDWWLIGLVFIICALAFLPQVGSLGYYHDDWFPTISRVSGVGLLDMHKVDRPVMGLWYTIINLLLGESPLAWHLFAFLAKFIGALGLYLLARIIWPGHRPLAAMISLVYAIYPGFLQQTSANNYQNHLVAYAACILSILLTVLALKSPGTWKQIGLTIPAALLAFVYPLVYEAMIGMEGFRFLIIWLVLKKQSGLGLIENFFKSVLKFIPYLAVMFIFLFWRFFVFSSARVSTDSGLLLEKLRSDPAGNLLQMLTKVIPDFFEMVLGAWTIPAYQLGINARTSDIVLALVTALIAVGILLIASRRISHIINSNEATLSPNWAQEAIWVGFLGVLVTLIPVAFTGRDVQYRIYYDRYTYQSIAPAAFLLAGLIFTVIKNNWQYSAAALLVFSAVFTHNLNAASYARNWYFQKQVWWQLTWRAPGISPGTTLIVQMPQTYRYPEDFEIWAPASRIYYPGPGPLQITAEVLNSETMGAMLNREQTSRNYRGVVFTRDFNQALITSMPTANSCLHVFDGTSPDFSASEDELISQVAFISRIDLIQTDVEPKFPPRVIFGKEPAHDWCYTYQKAGLAKQRGEWEEVVRLGDEAFASDLEPTDLVEYAPFIEGYLHVNRMEDARQIASILRTVEPSTAQRLCLNFQKSVYESDSVIAHQAISILCDQ
ncbi:MAG: hypothetical protein ACYC7M_12630 [Bellilinea sp.]